MESQSRESFQKLGEDPELWRGLRVWNTNQSGEVLKIQERTQGLEHQPVWRGLKDLRRFRVVEGIQDPEPHPLWRERIQGSGKDSGSKTTTGLEGIQVPGEGEDLVFGTAFSLKRIQ